MRSVVVAALLLSASIPASLQAQLQPGDTGVTWLSSNSFSVFRANGTTTVFNVGSFLGTGNTSTILLDPDTPDSFLIAGGGFIGRATITGPSTASYTLLTPSAGLAVQLGYDGASYVVADFDGDQLLRFFPASGAVVPITVGPQPWGTTLNAATVDPTTGAIYAGGNDGIWVLAPGSPTPQLLAGGWQGGLVSAFVSGIAIDPITFEPVITILTLNRVARVSSTGVLSDLVSPGSIPGPNAIDVDENGDFIVGASFGQIHRVPRAGGTPVMLGTAGGVIGAATGVARVKDRFRPYLVPLGGGSASLAMRGIPAGAVEGWTVPSLDVSLPLGAGPVFGMSPDALSILVISSYPAPTPGNIFHFSLPTAPPLFPADAVVFPPGTFPPGLGIDVVGVAVLPAAPPVVSAPRRTLF